MGRPKSNRMAECHPDRPHKARGMCNACYAMSLYRAHPEHSRELARTAARKRYEPRPRRVRPAASCHPELSNFARGLCRNCYYKLRRQEAPDAYRERGRRQSKKWREDNPERARELAAAHVEKHRDTINARSRDYYQRRGKELQQARRADPEIRARILAKDRAWHKANPEKSAALAKAKKAKRRAAGKVKAADILAAYDKQHGKCFWCGVELGLKYHADHYIPINRGGTSDAANIVAACGPCNLSRRDKMPWEWSPKS